MAYAFPLASAEFMDLLPVMDCPFDIPEAVEMSETDGGEIITAALGTRLWQGKITLGGMTADEEAEVIARIDVVRSAGGSFFCHDKRRPGPRLDPTGAALGASVPRIGSISADRRELSLKDLPVGYQLRPGDMLSFAYGSDPVRYALHRVASPTTAATFGVTTLFEVVPRIRPGAAEDIVVSLLAPVCKAVILPGSFEPGARRSTWTTGMSFRWIQTLR